MILGHNGSKHPTYSWDASQCKDLNVYHSNLETTDSTSEYTKSALSAISNCNNYENNEIMTVTYLLINT